MPRATGYLQVFGEKFIERDTFTCNHCNSVHTIKPFVRPEDSHGYCDKCEKLVCPRCVERSRQNGQRCDPWEEQMRRMEARYTFRRDAGLIE